MQADLDEARGLLSDSEEANAQLRGDREVEQGAVEKELEALKKELRTVEKRAAKDEARFEAREQELKGEVDDLNNALIAAPQPGDIDALEERVATLDGCLLYTSPSPRDKRQSRMPSSA